jgi:undecaprenyl-diphosphatase
MTPRRSDHKVGPTAPVDDAGLGRQAVHVMEPASGALLGGSRFGGLAALGLVVVLVGAAPFLVLLRLVEREWPPLLRVDAGVAASLNAWLTDNPAWVRPTAVVSELGGGATATVVLGLAAAWMVLRLHPRLALYVVVTGLGLALIVPVSKAIVGRARPELPVELVDLPSNASFPSGHSMTAMVTWGVVAALAWPRVRRRGLLAVATGSVVLVVGLTRLVLGVHWVSDVLAGWTLGAAWLLTTTGAFHWWVRYRGERRRTADDLSQQPLELHLTPVDEPVLAPGRGGWPAVAAGAAAIVAVLTGLGLLVTRGLDATSLASWDRATVAELATSRSEALTRLASGIEALSGLWGVAAVATATAVLALAYRGSWRPVAFVVLAVLGEVALYGIISQLVGRARPTVPDLTEGLPAGASFPSGHVAAATVAYGAAAVLVVLYSRRSVRWLLPAAAAAMVVAVMLARIYVAAHFPTDVVAGLLLGLLWLAVLARTVLGLPLPTPPRSWADELRPGRRERSLTP